MRGWGSREAEILNHPREWEGFKYFVGICCLIGFLTVHWIGIQGRTVSWAFWCEIQAFQEAALLHVQQYLPIRIFLKHMLTKVFSKSILESIYIFV